MTDATLDTTDIGGATLATIPQAAQPAEDAWLEMNRQEQLRREEREARGAAVTAAMCRDSSGSRKIEDVLAEAEKIYSFLTGAA